MRRRGKNSQDHAVTALLPAPVGKRFFAFIVDLAVIATLINVVLLLATVAVGGLQALQVVTGELSAAEFVATSNALALTTLGAVLVLGVLFYDGYFIYFEWKKGTTPGKKIFGLRVIPLATKRLSFRQCFWREFFRHFDCLLALFPLPGILSMSVTKKRQRLGDLAGKTMVVFSPKRELGKDFFYVDEEDFEWLRTTFLPKDVSESVCQAYLTFAYPEFVAGTQKSTQLDLNRWEEVCDEHLVEADDFSLDQESKLRFFAEHCFQQRKAG